MDRTFAKDHPRPPPPTVPSGSIGVSRAPAFTCSRPRDHRPLFPTLKFPCLGAGRAPGRASPPTHSRAGRVRSVRRGLRDRLVPGPAPTGADGPRGWGLSYVSAPAEAGLVEETLVALFRKISEF